MAKQTAHGKGGPIRNLTAKRGVLVRLGKPLGPKTMLSRREAEAWLIERADADPAFRRALIANPAPTITKALGVGFPADIKLRVIEESERELVLVLPAPVALPDGELAGVVGGRELKEASDQGGKSKFGEWLHQTAETEAKQ